MSIILNDSVVTENFSEVYPVINKYIIENGDGQESRYGYTREILNFKTTLTNPYKRCVGTTNRDMNIFFLLAEALWIFNGKKDVETLTKFNSKMVEFSDDKKTFHAPYGFRMRNYGISSDLRVTSPENNGHHVQQTLEGGIDQIKKALLMLDANPEDRRVVISIWNPELDLGKISKDIPCNDLVMFKIRKGKLHTTIANRSNDLHWGLPTNIFQFSFVSEVISEILGLELGTQTHNSQSLHLYTENEISWKMYEAFQFNNNTQDNIYSSHLAAKPSRLEFNFFECNDVESRLSKVDYVFSMILDSLKEGERLPTSDVNFIWKFSAQMQLIHQLLHIYLDYRSKEANDRSRLDALAKISELKNHFDINSDLIAMALNFFVVRLKDQNKIKELGYNPIIGKL